MGEYWKPVNVTRREFIHPHHVGCGLKLGEWYGYESQVVKLMRERWSADDDIRAVSDYDGQMRLSGTGDAPWPSYDDLDGDTFTEIAPRREEA